MNQARLARVLRNMERDGLTQIVISSTASVYYLTGYWVEPMERMLALYIRADGTCRLFANALFGLELVLHQDSDEPTAALAAALLPGTLGVDKAWPSIPHRPSGRPARRDAGAGLRPGGRRPQVQGRRRDLRHAPRLPDQRPGGGGGHRRREGRRGGE